MLDSSRVMLPQWAETFVSILKMVSPVFGISLHTASGCCAFTNNGDGATRKRYEAADPRDDAAQPSPVIHRTPVRSIS